MKILAFDQSVNKTGYSLFIEDELISYGLIDFSKEKKDSFLKMSDMYFKIKEIITEINPDIVMIENTQYQRNAKVFRQLSQLQGMIFSACLELNKKIGVIEPSVWKSFCGIKGRKRIEQKINTIQFAKEKYLVEVSEDVADSIGIGTWAINNCSKH